MPSRISSQLVLALAFTACSHSLLTKPDKEGDISFSGFTQDFSDLVVANLQNHEHTTAVENAEKAAFHGASMFFTWRNLGNALTKVGYDNLKNPDETDDRLVLDIFRVGKASSALKQALAAYRVAALLGDPVAERAAEVLLTQIWLPTMGEEVCTDYLDTSCEKLDAELLALQEIKDKTTAPDAVHRLCTGPEAVTIELEQVELDTNRLNVATMFRALVALRVCGVVVLSGDVIPTPLLKAMDQFLQTRADVIDLTNRVNQPGIQERGKLRFEVSLPLHEPFTNTSLIANPFILPLVKAVTRSNALEFDTFSSVLSFPGSNAQDWHRDVGDISVVPTDVGDELFVAPPHGLVMMIPLSNLNERQGPTEFAFGSHMAMGMFGPVGYQNHYKKLPVARIPLKRGSVLLFDIRVQHRGTENQSKRVRPLLYCSLVQEWFTDRINFNDPLSSFFDKLPTIVHQKLLARLDSRQYVGWLEKILANITDINVMRSSYSHERRELSV